MNPYRSRCLNTSGLLFFFTFLALAAAPLSAGEAAKKDVKPPLKAGGAADVKLEPKEEKEPEAQRRERFEAAYGSGIKEQQLAALETLRGGREPETGKSLYKVITVARDEEIRLAVFDVLCSLEDPDGSFAHLVALCFRAERERAPKVKMALSMRDMKYKWSALGELCRFAPQLGFPEVPLEDKSKRRRRSKSDGNYEDYLIHVLEVREQLVLVIHAINGLSGQLFYASRSSPKEIRAWWYKYNLVVLKGDADRREGKLPEETISEEPLAEAKKIKGEKKDAKAGKVKDVEKK